MTGSSKLGVVVVPCGIEQVPSLGRQLLQLSNRPE